MRLTDIVNRAGRSIKNAKARTLLTSLAIGVGAFTITLSLGAGEGGRDYTDLIVRSNSDPKEVIVRQKQLEASSGPKKYVESSAVQSQAHASGPIGAAVDIALLTMDDINNIKSVENVVDVVPNYSPQVTYITADGADKFLVSSLSPLAPGLALEFSAGDLDGGLADNEIVLNEEYADALGFSNYADAIGKNVTIRADRISSSHEHKLFSYKVRAVTSASGLAFRAQGSLLLNATTARELYNYVSEGSLGHNQFLVASARISDKDKANEVKDALIAKGYFAETTEGILGVVNTFINVLQGILLGFGGLAVLTSVFGIINTQYISVLERTQQIGLMKALGMRSRDAGRLFKFEAAWIGFLGGAIGSGLAVISGVIFNPTISEALGIGDIYLLVFNPLAVAGVIVGLMVVAVLAGIAPSRKAAKLDPIEALRTE